MKSASALVLWLLIVLLPLNGYANAIASGCASHRQPASMPATPVHHHHAGMAMATPHGAHHSATDRQCHCGALCGAQCAGIATLSVPGNGFDPGLGRVETPAARRIAAPRPPPGFDLLRPPKRTRFA
ncbi:hypothetical protein [Solimonas terrae]|uniref:Uncharacterized protein n=1 Tax=Solimonas terrae TaxID=1396819 RepID=A0A6M2BPS7_9GAMM|nr:hypothetical protein [Solimonas terrae]NGY04586.1 hypothetical protein [Solimonas terrae]